MTQPLELLRQCVNMEFEEETGAWYWFCDSCDAHLGQAKADPDHTRHGDGCPFGPVALMLAESGGLKRAMARIVQLIPHTYKGRGWAVQMRTIADEAAQERPRPTNENGRT